MSTTIVIGAGWAGLSCAYYLSKAGHQVTLIEAAPFSGGRARSVVIDNQVLDNGQHLCIGAYHNLRQLLLDLQLNEQELFNIVPANFVLFGDQVVHLKLRNFLASILSNNHFTWSDKSKLLKFCFAMWWQKFKLKDDLPLFNLLKNYQQSNFLIKHFWQPLVLAVMTTPIEQASSNIFLRVLQLSFYSSSDSSNWFIPKVNLSAILPQHIEQYLQQHGGKIILGQRITQLDFNQPHNICASSKQQSFSANHVVLAIAPWHAKLLLQPHPKLCILSKSLANFKPETISTIYLRFKRNFELPHPIIGLQNSLGHWIFEKVVNSKNYQLSVVISGSGQHLNYTKQQLSQNIISELQARFPELPLPVSSTVIKEKRAAFSCDVNIQHHRPGVRTNINNLWLAGDYLQTGLPATLEGAVLSGKWCAREIISPRSNQN